MTHSRMNDALEKDKKVSKTDVLESLAQFLTERCQSLAKSTENALYNEKRNTKTPLKELEEYVEDIAYVSETGSSILDEKLSNDLNNLRFIATSLSVAINAFQFVQYLRFTMENLLNQKTKQTELIKYHERMLTIINYIKKKPSLSEFIDQDLFIKLKNIIHDIEEVSAQLALFHGMNALEWVDGVLTDYRQAKELGLDLIKTKQIDLIATKNYLNDAKKDIEHKILSYQTLIEDSDESLRSQLREQMKLITKKFKIIEYMAMMEQKENQNKFQFTAQLIKRVSIVFWQTYDKNKQPLVTKTIQYATFSQKLRR